MGEENKDIKTKGCSLSIDNWMTLLSGEINRVQDIISQFVSTLLVFAAIVIAVSIPYVATKNGVMLMSFFVMFLIVFIAEILYLSVSFKKLRSLEEIRDYAISTESPDINKIFERWKQYRKLEKERNLK
jgi:ABC-type siderophore export system fused ATPase/permease subunit